jgi:hypothetical protein
MAYTVRLWGEYDRTRNIAGASSSCICWETRTTVFLCESSPCEHLSKRWYDPLLIITWRDKLWKRRDSRTQSLKWTAKARDTANPTWYIVLPDHNWSGPVTSLAAWPLDKLTYPCQVLVMDYTTIEMNSIARLGTYTQLYEVSRGHAIWIVAWGPSFPTTERYLLTHRILA